MNTSIHSSRFKMAGWMILLAALIYFPLFLHLTSLSVRVFDESRLALNAFEMLKTGNIIVTHYEGSPDLWNTKPPLMIWILAISIKIFGLNELALRLPSALAAVATCLFLLWFAKKVFQKFWLGFIAALVLVTSSGYIDEHVARTGDYDSLLVFLNCALLFCFFMYTESSGTGRSKLLLFFFILLTLSFLCKGIGGLLFLPSIGIYLLIRKQVVQTIRLRNFYIGITIFLVFGIGYYLLREKMNPGYLNAVAQNELGGRYLKAAEGHRGPFLFYIDNLRKYQFGYWFWLVPCGWIIGLGSANHKLRRLTAFLALSILTYLIVISSSQSKLEWYSAPLYPLMAFSVSILFNRCFEFLNKPEFFRINLKSPVAGYVMLLIVFIFPYWSILNKVYHPRNIESIDWVYDIPDYLKHVVETHGSVDGCKVVFNWGPSSILFYQKKLDELDQHITLVSENDLDEGDCAIISQVDVYNQIGQKFVASELSTYKNVKVLHINQRK